MTDLNIQMRSINGESWDNLYPKTKMNLVDGLPEALADQAAQLADIEIEVGQKADETYVDDQLSLKANQTALEETNSQVELRATKVYVDEQIANIGDGSPKGTYSNLAALQAAYPTGTEGIYLTTDNGHWYYWNGSAWTDGGTYQSTGIATKSITTEQVADNAIKAELTSFAQLGKNKFDGNYLVNMVISGAPDIGGTLQSSTGGQIALIKVVPGQTYTVTKSHDTDRFRICGCTGYPQVGTTYSNYWHDNETTLGLKTFAMGATEDYMMVYVSSASQNTRPSQLQVELGSTNTPYEPARVVIEFERQSVEVDAVYGYRPVGYVSGDPESFRIDMDAQTLVTYAGGSFITFAGQLYPIGAGEWDFSGMSTNSGMILYDPVENEFHFVSIEDTDDSQYTNMPVVGMLRRDRKACQINGFFTDLTSRPTPPAPVPNYILPGDDYSDYTTSTAFISMSDSNNVQFIYDEYDALMAAYPEYISRTDLGDSTGNRPIYRYDFVMPPVQFTTSVKPKIIINGGIHGHEKFSVYGALAFFKDLCNNWKNQKSLRYLRSNAHIIFIPLLNPDGYAANQRKNANGVDLARNFPAEYVQGEDPAADDYSGPYAGSEVETQIFMDLLGDVTDSLFIIDSHNYSTFSAFNDVLWIGSRVNLTRRIMIGHCQSYDGKVRQEYPSLEDESLAVTSVRNLISPGSVTAYVESLSRKGVILESVVGIGTTNDDAQKLNGDILGNLLLSAIRAYRDLM